LVAWARRRRPGREASFKPYIPKLKAQRPNRKRGIQKDKKEKKKREEKKEDGGIIT
jgi:hypothetical protein